MADFTELPFELHLALVKYLDYRSVSRLAQTCRSFRIVFSTSEIWKELMDWNLPGESGSVTENYRNGYKRILQPVTWNNALMTHQSGMVDPSDATRVTFQGCTGLCDSPRSDRWVSIYGSEICKRKSGSLQLTIEFSHLCNFSIGFIELWDSDKNDPSFNLEAATPGPFCETRLGISNFLQVRLDQKLIMLSHKLSGLKTFDHQPGTIVQFLLSFRETSCIISVAGCAKGFSFPLHPSEKMVFCPLLSVSSPNHVVAKLSSLVK